MSRNAHRLTKEIKGHHGKRCRRKSCNGSLVSVTNCYTPGGPVQWELECMKCQRTYRDLPQGRKGNNNKRRNSTQSKP